MRKYLIFLILLFAGVRYLQYFFYENASRFDSGFLTVTENINGAFSVPIPPSVMVPLSVGLIIIVLSETVRLYRQRETIFFWWGLIFIGGLSNALDRFLYGAVIDYINFGFWPIFNLADTYISIGIVWLVLLEIRKTKKRFVQA